MNRQQLEQYLGNPYVRKMLDVIASSEGVKHGYNTLFGNERFDGLATHPNIRKQFKQTDGKVNYTTAAGRYQFLNSTWNDVARQYGLKNFSPINQDLAAIALIARRGALNDVVRGNYQSAIHKLGEEWASLPTSRYAQGKRSWGDINKMLGGGSGQQKVNPDFINLTKLGYKASSKPASQPQFVDLTSLGYKPSINSTKQAKPQFVDLGALGYKSGGGADTQQPNFVDLKALGYKA